MNEIRFSFIGSSGSGKTNAIGSTWKMFSMYKPYRCLLAAEGATLEDKIKNAGILNDYANIDEDFVSAGTATGRILPVSFRGTFAPDLPEEPLLQMDLFDYPGGWLENITTEDSTARNTLLNRILSSDILQLFADANELTDPNRTRAQIIDKVAAPINIVFQALENHPDTAFVHRPRTIQILLTKCDSELIPHELCENHYLGLINLALEVFAPVVSFCQDRSNEWNCAIIPTSTCGNGNSKTIRNEYGFVESHMIAAPKPYGFDFAILHGICCELKYRLREELDLSAITPQEISLGEHTVSKRQWNYIVSRMGRMTQKRARLYRQYLDHLSQIIEPLCDSREIAEF